MLHLVQRLFLRGDVGGPPDAAVVYTRLDLSRTFRDLGEGDTDLSLTGDVAAGIELLWSEPGVAAPCVAGAASRQYSSVFPWPIPPMRSWRPGPGRKRDIPPSKSTKISETRSRCAIAVS